MKKYFSLIALMIFLVMSCNSKKSVIASSNKYLAFKNDTIQIKKRIEKTKNDTIRIANDSLQYEVIIIDPGFSAWLVGNSLPRGYHSQSFLENKNQMYITEWNNRVMQPLRYNTNLYEMTINYDAFINYGYEVNYLIYNYMIYFQNTFKQRLGGYVPIR